VNDGSKPLANHRHEEFAKHCAGGKTDCEAYAAAGYKGTPEKNASEIAGNPGISERIVWLKAEIARKVTDEFAWRDIDALNWALSVIQTPIGKIDKNHPLCQEYSYTSNEHGGAERWKMPAKMDALAKIIQIKGWDKGTEADRKIADALSDELTAIRIKR
jgi:hypothetical protein